MSASERQLAALALSLIEDPDSLTAPERELVCTAAHSDPQFIADARAQIMAGHDPLGSRYCLVRPAADRRALGATYTPLAIVDAMVAWAASEATHPVRIVDPGAGSGRFLTAAAERFPNATLVAVEVNPLATLMLRANAAVRGYADRLTIHLTDYRSLTLPTVCGATLFIGNPPYVRHHDIGETWKAWFASTASRFGFTASKLAGLHIHFFLKTRELARPGDFGAFITAAEWLDVNYGRLLRSMLADGLGGAAVHVIDPRAQPFSDALATGAITCFRVGNRPDEITLRAVDSLDQLAPLETGRRVAWADLASAPKWSPFLRATRRRPAGSLQLGDLFRVHRGTVTGSNAVWIDNEAASAVPARFKRPTVTRARELFTAGEELRSSAHLKRVIDLPTDLDQLTAEEWRAVAQFLNWAKQQGANKTYIAQHRRAWWAVDLRRPAPVLCTYMARQAPTFVLNTASVPHLNIAHGLYPRDNLDERTFREVLTYLRHNVDIEGGRTYAGGLIKFEPKELERLPLPPLEQLHEITEEVDASGTRDRRKRSEGHLSPGAA